MAKSPVIDILSMSKECDEFNTIRVSYYNRKQEYFLQEKK